MKSFKSYLNEKKRDETVDDFVDFATKYLNLSQKPNIIMLDQREPDMTSASYDPTDCSIKIFCGSRATFDICRSVAHEMVHQKQHEEVEDASKLDGSTGSPHEDEANAIAGRIVRTYGKSNPGFYDE